MATKNRSSLNYLRAKLVEGHLIFPRNHDEKRFRGFLCRRLVVGAAPGRRRIGLRRYARGRARARFRRALGPFAPEDRAAHRPRGLTGVRPDRPRTVLLDCFPSLQSAAGSGDSGEHAGGEPARADPAPGVRARLPGASGQYCAQGLCVPRRGLRSARIRLTCGSKTPLPPLRCRRARGSAHSRSGTSPLSTGISTVVEKFCGRLAGWL